MNWTGGGLQRHSNRNSAGGNLVARQRQHFAKARTRMCSGPYASSSSPPFKPSFIVEKDHRSSRSSSQTRRQDNRQTGLEEYESVAPLVKRLSAMTSRPLYPRDTGLAYGFHRVPHHPDVDQGQRPRKTEYAGSTSNVDKPSRRTQEPPRLSNHNTKQSPVSKPDTLEYKKRQLLNQRDWVGLSSSRPARLDYSPADDKHRIGKRRRLSERDKLRQQAAAGRVRVPSVREEYMMSGALQPRPQAEVENMRIRIGDDASLSQTSFSRSHRQSPVVPPSRAASLESMLLDDEQFEDRNGQELSAVAKRLVDGPLSNSPLQGFVNGNHRPHLSGAQNVEYSHRPLPEKLKAVEPLVYNKNLRNVELLAGNPLHVEEYESTRPILLPDEASIVNSSPIDLAFHATFKEHHTESDPQSCLADNGSALTAEPHDEPLRAIDKNHNEIDDDALWRESMHVPEDTPSISAIEKSVEPPTMKVSNVLQPTTPVPKPSAVDPKAVLRSKSEFERTAESKPNQILIQTAERTMPDISDADAIWRAFVFGSSSPHSDNSRPNTPRLVDDDDTNDSIAVHLSNDSQNATDRRSSSLFSSAHHRDEIDLNTIGATAASSISFQSSEQLSTDPPSTNAATKAHSSSATSIGDEQSSPDPLTGFDPKYAIHQCALGRNASTSKKNIVFSRPAPFVGTKRKEVDGDDIEERIFHVGGGKRRQSEKKSAGWQKSLLEDFDIIEDD